MKRIGNLLPRIADRENLLLAFWKAAKGHRHTPALWHFQQDLERECGALSRGQVFGNYYLDPLDEYVTCVLRCPRHVRFMDDFALWHDSRDQLDAWRRDIAVFLRERLKLELKPSFRLGPTREGMPFLGFRVLPAGLLLGRRARRRFAARLIRYVSEWSVGKMCSQELQRRSQALVAHTDLAACREWRRRVLARIRLTTDV